MWGAGGSVGPGVGVARIIPTHVGSSTFARTVILNRADHPHACGEQITNGNLQSPDRGSSPRMWGAGQHLLILAEVGHNTLCLFNCQRAIGDAWNGDGRWQM